MMRPGPRFIRLEVELLLRKYLRWPCRLKDHHDVRVCAIIQSYKRPQNIGLIVRILQACEFIHLIVVTNNNPEIDLQTRLNQTGDRLVLVQQKEKRPSAWRFEIASQYNDYDWYLNVDDDVFPFPEQLGMVITGLLENPATPAGCFAEFFDAEPERLFQRGDTGKDNCFGKTPRSLLWIYAFSHHHLKQYNLRLRELNLSNQQSFSDDVIFSMAGGCLPTVVPSGYILRCPTSRTPGIANYREPGFRIDRLACYQKAIQWLVA